MSYETLEKRLKNLKKRGVVCDEGQTLLDIYNIRTELYEKYADVTFESDNDSDVQDTALKIVEYFNK